MSRSSLPRLGLVPRRCRIRAGGPHGLLRHRWLLAHPLAVRRLRPAVLLALAVCYERGCALILPHPVFIYMERIRMAVGPPRTECRLWRRHHRHRCGPLPRGCVRPRVHVVCAAGGWIERLAPSSGQRRRLCGACHVHLYCASFYLSTA
jgi:hypothetical protein